jgi:hypothetical protein
VITKNIDGHDLLLIWVDPFVIVIALPTALAGIVWVLFASGTTLSVPALTGAIMCMGIATANSKTSGLAEGSPRSSLLRQCQAH